MEWRMDRETMEIRHFSDPVTNVTIAAAGLTSPWFGVYRAYLDPKS